MIRHEHFILQIVSYISNVNPINERNIDLFPNINIDCSIDGWVARYRLIFWNEIHMM